MPNHVTTVLTFSEKDFLTAHEYLVNTDNEVDFNRIIPQPMCIGDDGNIPFHVSRLAKEVVGSEESLGSGGTIEDIAQWSPDDFDLLAKYLKSYKETGSCNWYDWNCENWGTKWNAYQSIINISEYTIRFDTAWSCPFPVLDMLGYHIDFIAKWVNEDTGYGVGWRVYKDDTVIDEKDLSGTNEGYELAFELRGGSEWFELVDGRYECIEE